MDPRTPKPTSQPACLPPCEPSSHEIDEALWTRLAHRPLPAPSQRHRGQILALARTQILLRPVAEGGPAPRPLGRVGVAWTGSSAWWQALVKPQVLASGSAAAIAAMLLWGWQAGLLRQADAPDAADAGLAWTATTSEASASDTPVDLDTHLDRVRERTSSIVGRGESDIDRALTRTHRSASELESGATE